MTVQEKVMRLLLNSGIPLEKATVLLEKAKSEMPQMKNRWQDNSESYTSFSLAIITSAVRKYRNEK